MTFPITATLTLVAPPDEGLPNDELPFTATINVEQASVQKLKFTGAGTHTVNFGSIAGTGAKFILVAQDVITGAQPITCTYNTGTVGGANEVSPGGFTTIMSPVPVAGITSMEITYTANARVKVWIFS